MTEVIMPKMGDGMEEGTLMEWLKKEGEAVKSGEIIGTIQTDKATLELEAPGSGTLAGILIELGQTVPVGTPIAAILKQGESLPAGWGGASAPAATETKSEEPVAVASASATGSAVSSSVAGGRVKASPLAKKVASELGVDLGGLEGSGPGGRIIEKDVRTAEPGPVKPKESTPVKVQLVSAKVDDRTVPLNKIRQITAKRTTESKQTVPHFYVTVGVDLEAISAMRSSMQEQGVDKPSFNDFVIRAVALALRDTPGVNATYQGDHILEYGSVNVGMAVALDDGLTVAVIRNADQLSLRQISAVAKDLGERARSNQLTLEELTESTFSISNMGMLNVENFAAIINQPNAGIIAVSSAKKEVVVTGEDDLEVRLRMKLTGSFDHRIVDGAVGARFTNKVREYLENPMRLL